MTAVLPTAADLAPFARLAFADHRNIYDKVANANKTLSARDRGEQCPPLHMLAYAIRFILHPSLARNEIPNLLDLLAHIETIRREAVTQAKLALINDRRYGAQPAGERVLRLTEQEAEALESLVREHGDAAQSPVRRRWLQVTTSYCQLHVYNLWTSDDVESIPNFMLDYFPALRTHAGSRSRSPAPLASSNSIPDSRGTSKSTDCQLLRGLELNGNEQAELKRAAVRCQKFLQTAFEWQKSRKDEYSLKQEADLYRMEVHLQAFGSEVPCAVKEDDAAALAETYLSEVEHAVGVLLDAFPNDGQS